MREMMPSNAECQRRELFGQQLWTSRTSLFRARALFGCLIFAALIRIWKRSLRIGLRTKSVPNLLSRRLLDRPHEMERQLRHSCDVFQEVVDSADWGLTSYEARCGGIVSRFEL